MSLYLQQDLFQQKTGAKSNVLLPILRGRLCRVKLQLSGIQRPWSKNIAHLLPQSAFPYLVGDLSNGKRHVQVSDLPSPRSFLLC